MEALFCIQIGRGRGRHTRTHECAHERASTRAHARTRTSMHAHTHARTRTSMHAHTHARTQKKRKLKVSSSQNDILLPASLFIIINTIHKDFQIIFKNSIIYKYFLQIRCEEN